MGMNYFYVTVAVLLGTLIIIPIEIEGANVTGVRFGGTTGERSGVLEIQVDGNKWGVVCDDQWSTEPNHPNTVVACRALGFSNGGRAVLDGSYGDGEGEFLMDDTVCSADMTSLAQCLTAQGVICERPGDKSVALECNKVSGVDVTTFKPPATTKATSGVISDNCQDTTTSRTVQLIGRDELSGTGYVKIRNPNTNQWGFVCDDGWNAMAAKVVCRQLCFPTNYTAKPGIPAELKSVDIEDGSSIILDNVQCTGDETFLRDCPSNNFADSNDCSIARREIAGVQCVEAEYKPPNPPDPELECGDGFLKAHFYRSRDSRLETKHLSVLGDPNCADVSKTSTTKFVSIIIPVDKCGTTVSRNGTHILYQNEIRYASTLDEGAITRLNTYRVGIECALPVNRQVTQRVEAITQGVTEKADGNFVAGMKIYRSDSFTAAVTENPVRIPLGEYLNLAINMEDYDPRLKLVVTDCVATPTGDTSHSRTKVLFKDKCVVEQTLSTYPISNFEFGFRFKPFKFVNHDLLYIHCDSIICLAADVSKECDRTCNNTKPTDAPPSSSGDRRKRSATVQRKSMTSPAIFLYDPHDPGTDLDEDKIKVVIDMNDGATVPPTPPVTQRKQTPSPQTPTTTSPSASSPVGNQQQTPPLPADTGTDNESGSASNSNTKTDNDNNDLDDDDEEDTVSSNSQKDEILSQDDDNNTASLLSLSSSSLLLLSLFCCFWPLLLD